MAHAMFRGAASTVSGDIATRAFSIGVIGAIVAGEAATHVVKAKAWCEHRKVSRPPSGGRQRLDVTGVKITARDQLCIHSITFISNIDNAITDLEKIVKEMQEMKLEKAKLVKENFDLRSYMDMGVEQVASTVELEFSNRFTNVLEKSEEEADAEIRLLKLQVAKLLPEQDDDCDSVQRDFGRDLEFRQKACPQPAEQAQAAEKRIQETCGSGAMRFNIGSVDDLEDKEKHR